MKAEAVNWEAPLAIDDEPSQTLASRCTYDISALCVLMLNAMKGNQVGDDDEWKALVRMNAARIMTLNNVLISYLDEDGSTLDYAYKALHGTPPREGDRP